MTWRLEIWRDYGADADEAAALAAYAAHPLHGVDANDAGVRPCPDEPFVEAWERYVVEAATLGVVEALRRRLVQLRFPIAPGMSMTPGYRAATRRGVAPPDAAGLRLVDAPGLSLFLHRTAAGRIPIIVARAREDFVALAQAMTARNEPVPIPRSMGACLVAGYNNWDRFADALRRWRAQHPERSDPFGDVAAQKALYQDRFILLARGPYSATPAAALGLDAGEWDDLSLRIRLEHECAHYVMRQAFGVMRESLLDELVADYAGLLGATGRFRADWFLRFMGLEAFPKYRAGGRLENYRGSPPLPDRAFVVLQRVVRDAALQLDAADEGRTAPWEVADQARRITEITRLGLEGLARARRPAPAAAV
jgi:hypothetical protein